MARVATNRLRVEAAGKLLFIFLYFSTKTACCSMFIQFSACLQNITVKKQEGSDLKIHVLMRWYGPHALAVCRAQQGLPVGFLLLRYSVLFTVESLSLLYLLFIP